MTVPSSEGYLRLSPVRRAVSSFLRLLLVDAPLAWRLARHIKRIDAQLLHANDRIGSNRFVVLGSAFAGRRVIQHERLSAPYRWTDALLSGWTSATICVSSQVAEQALRQGHRGSGMRVIPNAAELPRESPVATGGARPRVGIVGRLVEWKGQDLFLEAMAILAGRNPDVEFVVAGAASDATKPYEEDLRAMAARPPLAGRVRFSGYVTDPLALMAELGVLVVASRTPEPFGRTVIEAMSVGVPVVAPAAGGPSEIIEHERTGLLFSPNDAPALAAAAERLLARPEWARQLADAGRRAVEARYRPETHARAVEAVYDNILAAEA
jgi:glycosyltransferase involved in cell wall biosynthesis